MLPAHPPHHYLSSKVFGRVRIGRMLKCHYIYAWSFPGSSVVKNWPADAGDVGLIPGLGRSLGEGNGNPLQYSCLGTPMDRGTCQATVHVVTKELDATEQLSNSNNNVYAYHFPPGVRVLGVTNRVQSRPACVVVIQCSPRLRSAVFSCSPHPMDRFKAVIGCTSTQSRSAC